MPLIVLRETFRNTPTQTETTTDFDRHETHYEYDQVNRRAAMVDALNQRTEYVYDDYDRLVRTTYHDDSYSTVEYDAAGRKVAETDQAGKRTAFAYDSVGNLVSVTDPMLHVTSYAYDERNNRVSQTDANGHVTTMDYDELGRLVQRTYPAVAGHSDVERFSFDPNGNMVAKVDGAGDSTVYTFDSRNREVLRRFSNSGHTVATHYTSGGNPDTVVDYRGMTTYEYGACCGQLVRVNNPDGSFLGYEYDANKNITARSTPWGTIRYTFDKLNRMDSVIAPDGGVTRYRYNPVGNRDSVIHANGTTVGYSYDALNRLLAVRNRAPDGTIQSSFTYELNPAGIRTAVTEADGSRVDYSYDGLYRLTGEARTGSHPYTIAFTYDNVGNRLTQVRDGVTTTYSYNDRDQLTSETVGGATTSYAYDGAGRLTSKTDASGTTTYGWQDNDRMVSVTGPSVAVSYVYDHEGRRVSESTSAGTKRYLIDGLLPYGQVVAETDSLGALVAAYVYGLERVAQERAGVTSTFAADGQGSVRQLSDAAGAVTDEYWYTAFGEELAKTGTTENAWRYTGEQADPNSGFYYLRARWMEARNGRYVSVDPLPADRLSPLVSVYLYGGSSPLVYRDPSGTSLLPMMFAIIGIAAVLPTLAKPKIGATGCQNIVKDRDWIPLGPGFECDRDKCSGGAPPYEFEDACGNAVKITCQAAGGDDDDNPCAYETWFSSKGGADRKIGECVFARGKNDWEILMNSSHDRILQARHRTASYIMVWDPSTGGGQYWHWQTTRWDDVTKSLHATCRAARERDWDETTNAPCQYEWW